MREMLGNSPSLRSERAVRDENSGKTIHWVSLNLSHVPAGVPRVIVPMENPLRELQSPLEPTRALAEDMLTPRTRKDLGGLDVSSDHLRDMHKLPCPFG